MDQEISSALMQLGSKFAMSMSSMGGGGSGGGDAIGSAVAGGMGGMGDMQGMMGFSAVVNSIASLAKQRLMEKHQQRMSEIRAGLLTGLKKIGDENMRLHYQRENEFDQMGVQVQSGELDLRMQQEALAAGQTSLMNIRRLQDVMSTQRAIFAARGQSPGQGTNAFIAQNAVSSFNADEEALNLSLKFKERYLKTNQHLLKMDLLARQNVRAGELFKHKMNTTSFNMTGDFGDNKYKKRAAIANIITSGANMLQNIGAVDALKSGNFGQMMDSPKKVKAISDFLGDSITGLSGASNSGPGSLSSIQNNSGTKINDIIYKAMNVGKISYSGLNG